jgi:hypothetical protein
VGIQNSDGSDGLQVVFNATYLHNDLAVKFAALTWLSVSPESGTIEPLSGDTVQVMFDATDLADSLYNGQLVVSSNDPETPSITIPAWLLVGPLGGQCHYIPGDINFNGQVNGVDVGYAVNYFKGFGPPPPIVCPDCPNPGQQLFGAGDVNGNCIFNGVDVTYFVNYLKGVGPALQFCPNCPPTIDVPNLGIGDPSRPIIRAKDKPMIGNLEE